MLTVNDPATVSAVTAAFEAYEAALIANDVPALQAFFWDSPLATRFGGNEQLYGAEAIAVFRQNRVVNFSQRHGLRTTIVTLGPSVGSVMYEYESVFAGRPRHGRQSQLWTLIDGAWKIVAAHVSLLPETSADTAAWTAYVQEVSAALRLPIDPAYVEGVTRHLEIMAGLAAPLMAFPLPAHVEPAPVFAP